MKTIVLAVIFTAVALPPQWPAQAEEKKKPDPVTDVLKEREKQQQQVRFLKLLEWREAPVGDFPPPSEKKYDFKAPWNG